MLWDLQGGKDNVARSIEYYHKALSLRAEDTLSTEMLTLALQVCSPIHSWVQRAFTTTKIVAVKSFARCLDPHVTITHERL